METEVKLTSLPKEFLDSIKQRFHPYTVELNCVRDGDPKTFRNFGSGVLVRKNNHHGILTAWHCPNQSDPRIIIGPQTNEDFIFLINGRGVHVSKNDIFEHVLGKPITPDYGPDLTFIEIAGESLDRCKAFGSFWPIDRDAAEIQKEFGVVGTVTCIIGHPEAHYQTVIVANQIHHGTRHMTYLNAVQKGQIELRNGWDYLNSVVTYTPGSQAPISFKGISGGPVWGIRLTIDQNTQKYGISQDALVGITFYQTDLVNNQRILRSHFIDSIYRVGWLNFKTK